LEREEQAIRKATVKIDKMVFIGYGFEFGLKITEKCKTIS
jgi:hypothetical protein